jgi:thymidylate kinase
MIYRGYLELAKKYDRIKTVNGEQDILKVVEETIALINQVL